MALRERTVHLLCAGVGAALLFTYGYFSTGSGPNQNTRYDLARAIVEEGRVAIDAYHENTIDKSSFGGHYYSDKAPGSSLLAVPAYAVAYGFERLGHPAERVRTDRAIQARVFTFVQLVCAALPGAILGVLVLLFLLRRGGPRPITGGALAAALALALGTQLFAYSTMLYGHVLAALGLLAGFFLLFRSGEAPAGRAALFAAGACFGFATLSEYPAAPAAAILLAVRFWPGADEPVPAALRRAARAAGFVALGAAPFAVAFAANNAAVTGSWFVLGYAHVEEQFQALQSKGFYGVELPRPGVLLQLLFGTHRGLFLLSPVLLASAFGFLPVFRRDRRVAVASLAVIAYYLLLNSSYSVWQGGAAAYPRHLTAAVPFFAPFVEAALTAERRWVRVSTRVAAAVSAVNGLVIVATHPQTPMEVPFPLRTLYRSFLSGELGGTLWWEPFRNDATRALSKGTNLGMRVMGEADLRSLVPLVLFWIAAALLARRFLGREGVPLWSPAPEPAPLDPSRRRERGRRRSGRPAGA